MNSIDNINLHTYLTNRELDYCPTHFVLSLTPLNSDSYAWILEKTVGRYSLLTMNTYNDVLNVQYTYNKRVPAFEDSAEAMLYELTWS